MCGSNLLLLGAPVRKWERAGRCRRYFSPIPSVKLEVEGVGLRGSGSWTVHAFSGTSHTNWSNDGEVVLRRARIGGPAKLRLQERRLKEGNRRGRDEQEAAQENRCQVGGRPGPGRRP